MTKDLEDLKILVERLKKERVTGDSFITRRFNVLALLERLSQSNPNDKDLAQTRNIWSQLGGPAGNLKNHLIAIEAVEDLCNSKI